MATIDNIVLSGVGKKIRNGFLNGTVSREKLIQVYNHNKKESAAFSTFGMTIVETRSQLHTCNNPIIKKILEDAIDSFEKNQELGKNQNEANFTKLDIFKSNALGVGLRRVISAMKKRLRRPRTSMSR